jgi:hypothetical protein
LFKKIKPLEIKECPFANLREKKPGRWGAGLTATKMVDRWLMPQFVGQFEFVEWTSVEWTSEGHLRHSKLVGLREDKTGRSRGTRIKAREALPFQLTQARA